MRVSERGQESSLELRRTSGAPEDSDERETDKTGERKCLGQMFNEILFKQRKIIYTKSRDSYLEWVNVKILTIRNQNRKKKRERDNSEEEASVG